MEPTAKQSPSLEDCLKLLRGERDEQRLAGLLLVTKFCKGDDLASLRKVYDAVGFRFLDRLLKTGMGTTAGPSGGGAIENREAYLHLSVTVLAAFCRIPEIASSEEIVSKVPAILEIISREPVSPAVEECYEFLYLTASASESGVRTLFESEGFKVLARQISNLPDGNHIRLYKNLAINSNHLWFNLSLQYYLLSYINSYIYEGSKLMELAVKIVQIMLTNVSLDIITKSYLVELSTIVAALMRQFAILQNAQKFELLHLLSAILTSDYSVLLHDALQEMANSSWSDYLRVGIVAILQNRLAPVEKLHALILADSAITITNERWLIGQVQLADVKEIMPVNRCLLLVLESSRVEVAVLLNDIAYLKYEASKDSSTRIEDIRLKQRNLAIAFSLIEKIIKLISTVGDEGDLIEESTIMRVINGLNETIGLVLEYIQDAKDHGQRKGDDLLASVRVIGSYLAETPMACEDKVKELLGYLLSIEGADESGPFYSVCFLLPLLCQITMKPEGCKMLISSGGQKAVVECLVKLIGPHAHMVEDGGRIFLACDTILNLLLKGEQLQFSLEESLSVDLLIALACFAENAEDQSVTMMASSICSLVLGHTSEDHLRKYPGFDQDSLEKLFRLLAKSLASQNQDESDLYEIVASGYSRWSGRFPSIKKMIART